MDKENRELVLEAKIKREAGYLYFIASDGNIYRTKANRSGRGKGNLNKD
jgi:hypothetical protein